jgi:3-methylfumaryl-CoA hydratase
MTPPSAASVESRLDRWPAQALAATLDVGAPALGDELPPLWHWLYFLRTARRTDMGPDGHPADPDLVDPSDPRRRMFAAARVEFVRPLRFDQSARMTQSLIRTRDTQGSGGSLRIVTFEHRYEQQGGLCVREERDIIYIKAAAPAAQTAQPDAAAASAARATPPQAAAAAPPADTAPPAGLEITPDPVMLMRFSALTFNAHRIHYDQAYAQREEGYPERLVHGPLTAILLAELLRIQGIARLQRFEFRARRPLFVNQPIRIVGVPADGRVGLSALDGSGALAMEATASLGR